MDFYYMPLSPPCRSVLMAAKALGINLNKKHINLIANEHLSPEFVKINPQHSVPTLVDNGLAIWESRAMLIYLAEQYGNTDTLYPSNPKKKALVNQRLFFDVALYQSFYDYNYPQIMAKAPADPEKLQKVHKSLSFLNTFLEGQSYVTGDNFTIADIALLASISTMDIFGINFTEYPNIVQWYENLKQNAPGWQENWEACLESKKFVENM